MAAKLNTPPSTVKSWHTKRAIPAWRFPSIMEAAQKSGIQLILDELENVRSDENPMQPGRKDSTTTEEAA